MRTGRRSCRVYEQLMSMKFKLSLFKDKLTVTVLYIHGSKLRVSLWLKQRYFCSKLFLISPWVEQEASPNLLPSCLTLIITVLSLPFFTALPHPRFLADCTSQANLTPEGQGHTYFPAKTHEERAGQLVSKGDLSLYPWLHTQNAHWPQGPDFHLHPWKNLINLPILAGEQISRREKINVNFQR